SAPLALTACGAASSHHAADVANTSMGNLGCKTSQSEMWNALHKIAEIDGAYPSGDQLRVALLESGQLKGLEGSAFEAYVDAFVANYEVTLEGIKSKFAPADVEGWKKALSEMEVGIRVTSIHAELTDKIESSLKTLAVKEEALGVACESPETGRDPAGEIDPQIDSGKEAEPVASTIWEQLRAVENPEVVGARRVLSNLYQSCDVLSLPAMTSATAPVTGITILAERHPAGGMKRVYGNKASINESHYYIKGMRLAKPSCFEVRNSPPIYDFGGKPYASSSAPMVLDMFRDAGSGTSVLGIDCSGYVFSALAIEGLKMNPDPAKPLKATLVSGIPARAYMNPAANGLRCMAKIAVTKTRSVEPGDIIAISGHVVMIDEVGADPFGLARAATSADCTAAKLTSAGYDFVIAQSSPSKDGIGVNRFQARDYLKESSTFREGLGRHAVAACRAKFGLSATIDSPNLSVVRHKRTAECRAPEKVRQAREECVSSCKAI
ncbi:MAG TPA: hypothetical protein PKC28_16070, partial [Bdellovibrionales bacterium]|nr:hypothetical protein [Bdellovibrionales bacterium]